MRCSSVLISVWAFALLEVRRWERRHGPLLQCCHTVLHCPFGQAMPSHAAGLSFLVLRTSTLVPVETVKPPAFLPCLRLSHAETATTPQNIAVTQFCTAPVKHSPRRAVGWSFLVSPVSTAQSPQNIISLFECCRQQGRCVKEAPLRRHQPCVQCQFIF